MSDIDSVVECEWRNIANWNVVKSNPPDLIPGLPTFNEQRILNWREKQISYRLSVSERRLHGIP